MSKAIAPGAGAPDVASSPAVTPSRPWAGSEALYARSREVLAGGVNHNIRQVRPFPLYYARGEGARKWDVDGNEYVDYGLAAASLLLGHASPIVAEAIADVFSQGVPAACHEAEIAWAQLVCDLVPSAERVRFLSSGTEATLLAMRLARAHAGRDKVVRFQGCYHGWHDYAMVGMRAPYDAPSSAGVPRAALDTMVVVPLDIAAVEAALAAGDVAAVIIEPSGPGWGTVPLPEGFLAQLREATTRAGVLLIFDEVITGFRWAPGGAQSRFGVVPDLTALGKIISGGFQGGAVAGRGDLMGLLGQERAGSGDYVFHYGTFNGHPLSAAAGIATLRVVATGAPNEAADAYMADFRAALQQTVDALGVAGFIYGESSMFHVYLTDPDGARAWDGRRESVTPDMYFAMPPALVQGLQLELKSRGLDLLSYNGGFSCAAHGPRELEQSVTAFEGSLRALRDAKLVAA